MPQHYLVPLLSSLKTHLQPHSFIHLAFHRNHNTTIILETMSSALPNLATTTFSVSPLSSHRRRPVSNNGLCCVKAVGGDGRDNLDHLKRASKQQVSQTPKKRVVSAVPIGK